MNLKSVIDLQMILIQGCGAVTFLVGSGSGSGSGEAFRLRLRLRLRVKLFGGSGSGSGQNVPAPAAPAPAPPPMIKSLYERFYDFIVKSLRLRFLPGIRFSKMTDVKTWLLTDLAVSLIATLNECFFFNLSLIVIQGHWRTLHCRGHRLRVALSEISGLGPKWSLVIRNRY